MARLEMMAGDTDNEQLSVSVKIFSNHTQISKTHRHTITNVMIKNKIKLDALNKKTEELQGYGMYL